MNWPVNGHKEQLEFLDNSLSSGRLAHAYIFSGPAGVGKKAIAQTLAHKLLAVELGGNNFHADYLELSGDGSIKIEQIRDLIYKLSLKPYASQYKVAVIDRAEEMTTEAANALLKQMEEPKSYTIIILITSNAAKLPRTILSRGQKINFGPLPGSEEQALQTSSDFLKYYQIFNSDSLPDKLLAAYEIADLETPEIEQLLRSWLLRLELELRTFPSKTIANKISHVAQALKYFDQNVNSKLLLTNLMLYA